MFEHLAWITIVNLALYFRTLRFKFVSDDFSVSQQQTPFKNRWHKAWLRFIGAVKLKSRSVHFCRYEGKWVVAIAKKEEMEHFIALLIHIAICISIYFAFGASQVSFIAALLYSTNPFNNQGTIWPGGRGYALPILSLTLAMAVPILSPILLYFCSWFTIGFLAPLALIGSERWYLLGLMPFIWFLHSRKFKKAITYKSDTETYFHDKQMHPRKIIIYFKTYFFYLLHCIVPYRVTFYHSFMQSLAGNDLMRKKAHALDLFFWAGVTAWFGSIVYACMNWGPIAWGLIAFIITISPFCNVVRANQEIAERFTALPNVFLMFALAHVIAQYPIAVTAFLVFYATRTFYTIKLYQDEYYITECAVIEDPNAWWAWHCRAMKRWETQSYREALLLWVMAKLISPQEFKVLINISTCLRLLNNHKEAEEYLDLAKTHIVRGQEEMALQVIEDCRKGKAHILL